MAVTQNTYTGNGATVLYSFTFPYLETTDIKVSVNGTPTTAYTLANATTIQFNSAPANGAIIRIYRTTNNDQARAIFFPGSAIRSQDLNDNYTQILYATQEVSNYTLQDVGNVTLTAAYTFSNPISGQTPSTNSHLATKGYVDGVAFASGNLTVGDKGDITVNSGTSWTLNSNSVTSAKIPSSAVTYAKIQNVSATDRLLGRSSAGSGVVEEITCTATARTLLDDASTTEMRSTLGVPQDYTVTTTGVSKTLVNRERCTVTASGLTLTLPASPSPGWEVGITVAGTFTNTIIGRNSSNIMSLAEDLTLNVSNGSITLYYVDATRGWRLI